MHTDLRMYGILDEYCWTHTGPENGGWSCLRCLYILALRMFGTESVQDYADTLERIQEQEGVAA